MKKIEGVHYQHRSLRDEAIFHWIRIRWENIAIALLLLLVLYLAVELARARTQIVLIREEYQK